ncbi:MAG TPA: lmo0937 family membrane protein [Chloroflexota bacterium]|nr:lmo0937 family membrane protein [Chloroflexota bacterium]
MLWTLLAVVLVLWLLGFLANVGSLIHLLLVVALIILIAQLLTGRRTAI